MTRGVPVKYERTDCAKLAGGEPNRYTLLKANSLACPPTMAKLRPRPRRDDSQVDLPGHWLSVWAH